jgi:hypothetical protein
MKTIKFIVSLTLLISVTNIFQSAQAQMLKKYFTPLVAGSIVGSATTFVLTKDWYQPQSNLKKFINKQIYSYVSQNPDVIKSYLQDKENQKFIFQKIFSTENLLEFLTLHPQIGEQLLNELMNNEKLRETLKTKLSEKISEDNFSDFDNILLTATNFFESSNGHSICKELEKGLVDLTSGISSDMGFWGLLVNGISIAYKIYTNTPVVINTSEAIQTVAHKVQNDEQLRRRIHRELVIRLKNLEEKSK